MVDSFGMKNSLYYAPCPSLIEASSTHRIVADGNGRLYTLVPEHMGNKRENSVLAMDKRARMSKCIIS